MTLVAYLYESVGIYVNGNLHTEAVISGSILQDNDLPLNNFSPVFFETGTSTTIRVSGDASAGFNVLDGFVDLGTGFPALAFVDESLDTQPTILYSHSATTVFPETLPALTTGTGVVCFLQGTRIDTGFGEKPIEDLTSGETVLTSDGRIVPIKWIGRQVVWAMFGTPERLMPVRFSRGSLGNNLPHSDLTVTADHAMLVDGVLCNASALVNGSTITRVPLAEMGKTFTVYHIETEAHEIILANGAPAETFIDNVSRRVFDNYAEYEALYGDTPEMTELPYPRAMSARQVPSHIRAELAVSKVA